MKNWEIKPNGNDIIATNLVTGEVFSGTRDQLNTKLAGGHKDSFSRRLYEDDFARVLSSDSSTAVVYTIPMDNVFISKTTGLRIRAYQAGTGSISFAAANGVTLRGVPSSAQYQETSVVRTGPNEWRFVGVPVSTVTTAGGAVSLMAGSNDTRFELNRVLFQSAIPVGISPSGTVATGGIVTFGTALPIVYTSGIFMYFPAAAVYAASAAGFYYVVMNAASQTVGTIYDNIYVPGVTPLAIPATPSPIAATGPGAFTGSTLALTVAAATIPGSSLGKNGRLDFQYYGSNNNTTAQNKIASLNLGGQQLHSLNNTTTVCFAVARLIVANRGREDRQVSSSVATNGQSSAPPLMSSVDTTVDTLVEIKLQHSSSATDVIMLECASIVADVG